MALNSLFCADVPLSNYSLTSKTQSTKVLRREASLESFEMMTERVDGVC